MFGSKPEPIGLTVEEFWRKWATGRETRFAVPQALLKPPLDSEDDPTIYDLVEKRLEVCEAPLGDFIAAYMLHLQIPPNRQRDDWAQVSALFRQQLNRLSQVRYPRLG